ncbi:MAG TPA: tetratricopeptide repeat protein [Terriglobia bacterium]|nr:tetratricopeptide repeat protein [Terriglobia bacterium]
MAAPETCTEFGPRAGESRWPRGMLPTLVLAATFATYTATLVLGFVFDDHVLIVTNDSIRSWQYFPSYFKSHIWSFRYPHLLANYYRPLFLIWLRLNDSLFGLHAWGWHLTSVLAHVAVTYLVYHLGLRLARDRWIAGAAGLIFGLHPVHAEAVADITSIQEPLASFFILAALLAFFRSRESGARRGWLAASLFFAASALLSKESGMVLPLLIGGWAWIYGGTEGTESAGIGFRGGFLRHSGEAGMASIPFWIVVLLYVPVRIHALKGFAHIVTPLSWKQELGTIPSVLLFYLRLLVWPFGLSCYYDTPYVASLSWNGFLLSAIVLAAVIVVGVVWYLRTRVSAPKLASAMEFAWLWLILTLLPVLNFRYLPANELAHDRYLYLPSVGFVFLVAIALRQIWNLVPRSLRQPVWVLAGGGLLACAGMGYATARQTLFWSDDLTLNYRAHQIAPRNVSATTSLAAAVAEHGMDGVAMSLYQEALVIQPEFWRATVNLAYLYFAQGKYPEAAQYFARACAADPTDGDQFLYLGMSLLRIGKPEEAEKAVHTALLVRPEGKDYHLGLGLVLKAKGDFIEARQEVERELALDPQNPQAQALLKDLSQRTNTTPKKK